MAKNAKLEKYPILRYLSYLVIVCILLTGVSLARYTSATSGDVSASLSRFIYSYSISDASSLIFSNTDYWLTVEGGETSATNTARSVRFDLRNHLKAADGSADRVSDVALQSTLRFYAPAEFAGNLAMQILQADNRSGAYTAVTPQYVLGDLIYEVNEVNGKYEQTDVFAENSRTIETGKSKDYSDRTDGLAGAAIAALEQELSVSGGFREEGDSLHTGTITALAEDGTELSLTSVVQTARYSVGFRRTEARTSDGTEIGGGSETGKMAPLLYLDCEKEMSFYTVDFTLPEMYFRAAEAESKTFVLCITLLGRSVNSDFSAVWGDTGTVGGGASAWEDLLAEPSAGTQPYTFNGAAVRGYHFTRDLPVWQEGAAAASGETTVRINKVYDYENGGATLSYDHVAPISEAAGSASVEHAIEAFYSAPSESAAAAAGFGSVTGVNGCTVENGILTEGTGLYGLCANEGKSGYIYFGGLSDDPFYDTFAEQFAAGRRKYALSEALSKGYSTVLTALFAQASESPAAEGGGV